MFRDSSEIPASAGGGVCVVHRSVDSPVRGRVGGPRRLLVAMRDGVRLAVHDVGPQHCAPEHTVVLLHGWCMASVAWARQRARLRRRYGDGLRLLAIDHRGHGNSDAAPMHTCRIEQLAEDIAVVLKELDVAGPMTLVGHSMGGMAALEYMARPASQRPVDPVGLVLVATAAGKLSQRGLGRLLATPATPALGALLAHTPQHLVKAAAAPVCAAVGRWAGCGRAERATAASLAVSALARTPVATAVGFLPSLRDWDQSSVLPRIRAKTVIVSGSNDQITPVAHADELAAGIPGATHVQVAGAGHMLPQQAPLVIDEAIRSVIGLHRGEERGGSRVGALTAAPGGYTLVGAGAGAGGSVRPLLRGM